MTRWGELAMVCMFLAVASTMAHADDQDVIDYRAHIMNTMQEQAAAISQILEQKAPAENFAVHAQILAVTAATAKKAFEPKVLGGEAKPDVWAHWADFAKRLDDLTAAWKALANAAKTGGVAAGGPMVQAASTCKGCHDAYRVEKKK
jgi:cytochrome c556